MCTEIPPPNLDFQFSVEPAHPKVGDDVKLSFTVTGSGGIPQYTLSGAAPVLQGDTSPMHAGQLGTVTYMLTAAQAGTAILALSVDYETAFGCAENPIFQFVSQTSPPFTVDVVELTPTVAAISTPTSTVTQISTTTPAATTIPTGTRTVTPTTSHKPTPSNTTSMTATISPTVPVTLTPTRTSKSCVGDCNSDGQVTVNELIQMVNIALGNADVSTCTAGEANGDGMIEVNEIIAAVNNGLNGCPTN